MELALYGAGAFSVALGVVHFFLPVLLDFHRAIPNEGESLKPFRLLFYRYDTKRSDVRGIAWVMNYAVSFTLVSIGIADLFADYWLNTQFRWIIALWISVWWLLRAICQLYLGKRKGDLVVMAWFVLLSIIHLAVAVR